MNMMMKVRPPAPHSNDAARRSLRFRKLVSLFERDEIEAATDALIAYLDAWDGNADREETGAEDGFATRRGHGPGCSISDPGGGDVLDERHDEEPDKEDDGRRERKVHRDRIRRTRCAREVYVSHYDRSQHVSYRLPI